MRFLSRFQLGLLLVAALALTLLFGFSTYAGLAGYPTGPRSAWGLRPDWTAVALTPARYQGLRGGLVAVGLVAAALLGLTRRPAPRPTRAAAPLWPPRRWLSEVMQPWQALRGAERGLAAGLLGVVALARLYYAGYYPLSLDEVASYDYFVLPGPAITASYYSIPNNHILPNLFVGLVHELLPGASPEVALRLLPTLLGLATLPLVYTAALRYLRFGVATLGLGLFWLSPLSVYYAVAGRGYAWTLAAALGGLFATAELLRPGLRRAARQRAWLLFGGSGVVGLYAVPTHLYALLGLGLGLAVGFGAAPARVRALKLAQLAVATLGIAAVAAVLYAPVGAVSGWAALFNNRYVARHDWPAFRQAIGPFLVGTATELLGRRGLSAAAYCLVLGLAPVVLRWGRLPAPTRRLGWLLWLQLALWLPLALAQHVYPPARTLLLVLLAFFLLLGLLSQAAWASSGPWAKRAGASARTRWLLPLGLLVVLGAYGGYRLRREQLIIEQQQQQQQQLRQAYAWLRRQSLRRIWVEPRAYAIFWQHYALSAGRQPLPLVELYEAQARGAQPGAAGEVEVLRAGTPVLGAERPVRYRNSQVVVVPLSPTQPLLRE